MLAIIIYFFIRRSSQAQNGIFSFGQSRARMYMGGKTQDDLRRCRRRR